MINLLLYLIAVFWIGTLVGFLIKAWLQGRLTNCSGVLVKTVEEGRILYSLELYEQIEELEANDTITFKVISSEEMAVRD